MLPSCSLVALSVGVYNRYLGGIDSYPVKAWIFTGFFSIIAQPFNSQDLIIYSPLLLLHITLFISYENLVLDQDDICQISVFVIPVCWIMYGHFGRSSMFITSGSWKVKLQLTCKNHFFTWTSFWMYFFSQTYIESVRDPLYWSIFQV